VAIDPFLYVAFALGFVVGRFYPSKGPWPARVVLGVVVVLLALLGSVLAATDPGALWAAIPVALALVALVLGFTALIAYALRPHTRGADPRAVAAPSLWIGPTFIGALLGGFVLGRWAGPVLAGWIEPTLYVLLALVGFDLRWSTQALRRAWVPLVSAIGGATVAATIAVVAIGLTVPIAFGTTLGFGFYSFAGPFLADRIGATAGFVAFLTNFLRENLTMVSSPYVGRALRGEGLAALGGATAMDTTLYFVTRYGDPDAGSLALSTGLVLTIGATLALPLVLGLAGA